MEIQKWFEGKIHSIDDPEKLGRVQVEEVLGHTVGKYREDPDNLFWSHVLMSPFNANANGIGISPHGLTKDSKVLGFKINDALSYVVGTIAYAQDDNNHSISRLAREKGPVRKEYLEDLGEKKSEYAAKYPHNKTLTTTSGHVLEIDDTPKAERIHVYHKSGAYVEIFPDGSIVTKSMKDSVSVTMNNHSISVVKGDLQIIANEGKIQIAADGDIDLVSKSGVVNIQGTDIGLTGNIYLDGDVELTGKLTSDGDVISDGISLQKHKHSPTGSPPLK